MYVYIKSEARLWTVGHYDPSGQWHPESDHDTREAAAQRVAWLNGGQAPTQEDQPGSWEDYKSRYGH